MRLRNHFSGGKSSLEWNLVRYHDRTTLQGVYIDGRLVLRGQDPVLFDGKEFFEHNAAAGSAGMAAAPVHKVHRHLDRTLSARTFL